MDTAALSHDHLFYYSKYGTVLKSPKEIVVGYKKLIDINLEPIKNYKSHLDELIEDTKKLEIEYKEFYNFFFIIFSIFLYLKKPISKAEG